MCIHTTTDRPTATVCLEVRVPYRRTASGSLRWLDISLALLDCGADAVQYLSSGRNRMDDEDSLLGKGVGCMIDPNKVAKAVVHAPSVVVNAVFQTLEWKEDLTGGRKE